MLVPILAKLKSCKHDFMMGQLLVVSESYGPYRSMPLRDVILNALFFGGAIFAPLYFCVLRDILRKICSLKYKRVKTPKK